MTFDPVTKPAHYNQGEVECIDAIKAALTAEEYRGYAKGNALKYLWRERIKGGAQDVQKAAWYLSRIEARPVAPNADTPLTPAAAIMLDKQDGEE